MLGVSDTPGRPRGTLPTGGLTSKRPARSAWKATRMVRALPLREYPRLLSGVWQTMASSAACVARRSSPDSFFPAGTIGVAGMGTGPPAPARPPPAPPGYNCPIPSSPSLILICHLLAAPRGTPSSSDPLPTLSVPCWVPSPLSSPAVAVSGVQTRRTARKSWRSLSSV